jgi:hypothetical protein
MALSFSFSVCSDGVGVAWIWSHSFRSWTLCSIGVTEAPINQPNPVSYIWDEADRDQEQVHYIFLLFFFEYEIPKKFKH